LEAKEIANNRPSKRQQCIKEQRKGKRQKCPVISFSRTVLEVMLNKLCCSSQAALPESIWLLSSMVQEVLSIMAEETSDDVSTS